VPPEAPRAQVGWRPRHATLALVPPALLVAVALLQAAGVQRYHLSPWKGGGFGMFSTVDRPTQRGVFAYLHDGSRRDPIDAQGLRDLAALTTEARVMPTPATLATLAERIGRLPWGRRTPDSRPVVVRTPDGAMSSVHVARIEVEVWRLAPRRERSALERELLARGEWRAR
jgi:hypothetical protein